MSDKDFIATGRAICRIKELLATEISESKLRIKVLGGGCSGFKYDYRFDNNFVNKDEFFADGLIVIDYISMPLLKNSQLDYQEDLGGASFFIMNPNTSVKCGCGNSFSV